MKGEEINFLDPYDTKICMQFFWFYQHFSGTCILFIFSFGSSTTAILIVYFPWIPEWYCLRFKGFCEDVSVCCTALFHLEMHATIKTLGRMGRTCLRGSWSSTLEVFCFWSSPLGMPAPDHRRCSSRSTLTWNNLTQQDMSFPWPLSHPTVSRSNGEGPFESSKKCFESRKTAHLQVGLTTRER